MTEDLLKEPLAEPWTFGVTKDGRVFFINDDEQRTTWLHPDTGQPAITGFYNSADLPNGWEKGFSPDGDIYYIDHNSQKTTFQHPNATTTDDKLKNSTSKRKKRRASFTETLTRPLFRRSSVREKRPSSARNHSAAEQRGMKMTVVRRDPGAVATRSGWLFKQDGSGVGGMKIWRKRWFVLSDFCLFYYKDSKEDEVLGSIVLPSYKVTTVNPDDKINRKYAFKIAHPGMRSYYISAESYHVMAEWVTDLVRHCTLPENKSGSRKSLNSKENQDNKITDEEEAFGFSEPRKKSRSSERESSSSSPYTPRNERKPVANGNNNNAKKSPAALQSQQYSNARLPRSSSASNRTNNSSQSSESSHPRRQNSVPPRRHPAHGHDHTGPRHAQKPGSHTAYNLDVTIPKNRRHSPDNKIERNNSMLRLGNWVQNQKIKQQTNGVPVKKNGHLYDTASEMSSISSREKRNNVNYRTGPRSGPQRAPSSGKRYKPGTYSDYMDSAEVASSIMSVPPMYRGKMVSLPRPRSSQDVGDDRSRRQKMMNSKSVGYLTADTHKPTTKTKSDYSLSPNHFSASNKSPLSANSIGRTYDDVFSPLNSNPSKFRYESATTTRTPSFYAAISPNSTPSSYEVKEVDVRGKQGQLRAFAISSRTPNSTVSVPQDRLNKQVEKLEINEDNIERKLERLAELDHALGQLSHEIHKLQNDKRRLEESLNKAKSRYSPGAASEIELERKLTKVKSQLSKSTQRLKEISKDNEAFEREVRKMKAKLLEELGKKIDSKPNQRQLEWELGRIQLIMEGVNKNKVGLVNKIQSFDDDSISSDLSAPNSARSGTPKRISGTMPRSPRDLKSHASSPYARASSSSSSTPQENKYFTLPGRGVSRATSVDSLTAATIARFTRPTSARSTNLHRTKSAAERLFSSSHGNLASAQDPDEIKKIQREINMNRLRALSGDFSSRSTQTRVHAPPASSRMPVGIDVQMAIKNHRMPKVLQRAKREMQRAEAERKPVRRDYEVGFDIDRFEDEAEDKRYDPADDVVDGDVMEGVTELDVEPEDLQVDLNLTHQLLAPDKVDIPDRLIEYEDVELSPEQEKLKQKKIRAIETMLSRSGKTASQPSVHLAAALAAEAGSAARAVAFQAQQSKELNPSLV